MTFEAKVLWLGGLVLAAVASGCGQCDVSPDRYCFTEGEATVDLSGDVPVFGMTGLSDDSRAPNSLIVHPCGGSSIWWVKRIEDPTRVTYGVEPEGAKVVGLPHVLEQGEAYVFYFMYEDENPLTMEAALQRDAWTGSFVNGDPDSFVLGEGRCEELQIDTAVP